MKMFLPLAFALILVSWELSSAFTPQGVDPFELLGFTRGGELVQDPKLVKRAYRAAALKWHPDKAPPEKKAEAEKKFIQLAWAYEVLSDPTKRRKYEQMRQDGPPAPTPSPSPAQAEKEADADMKEAARVFKDVFGAGNPMYKDLVNHLAQASGTGSRDHWRKHAEEIKKVATDEDAEWEVSTSSEDGAEKSRTTRKVHHYKGGRTETTETQHTSTISTEVEDHARIAAQHAQAMAAANAHHADIASQQQKHMEVHQKQHEANVKRAQRSEF
mmetsp:Transcript_31231/g.72829  ORF Transcript_31231/g.72829 Transcript_31231/m.72829 type:complete len:272 (+) Transcript_31231:105-920(+)